MDLSKICFATAMVLVISQMVLGEEPDYKNPDVALRHDMWILDADVRKSALSGYKRRFNLSDDEFSAQLVKLASVTTNGEEATLRMFTVAALSEFGTTNALDFLENEALYGGDVAGGITGYGLIVDFDNRFFDLAERMLTDKSRPNRYRRNAVFDVFRALLTTDAAYWKPVPKTVRDKAEQSLLRAALVEDAFPVTVDDILLRSVANYNTNPQRRLIAQHITQMPEASDYVRNYFKTILEQMERDNVTTKDGASSVAGTRDSGKQADTNMAVRTLGLDVESVEDLSFVDNADVDVPSTHTWLYMMIGGVLLFALVFLFIRLRKRRNSLRQ